MKKEKEQVKDKKTEEREREIVKLFQMKTVKPGDAGKSASRYSHLFGFLIPHFDCCLFTYHIEFVWCFL
ncbi:hypothetical protein EON65_09775 [archaeon]|nr:MAG: hypothetical protein EON65_09775 [archaeon]